jgi:hypothetical protein
MELSDTKRQSVVLLCKKYRVKQLHAFGSVLNQGTREGGDVDFLVEFSPEDFNGAFDRFMDLKEELEKLLGRPVDLVSARRFRNPIFEKEVKKTKRLIYAA